MKVEEMGFGTPARQQGQVIKRKRKPGKSIPNEARHTVQRLLRLRPDEDAAVRAVATARGVPVSRAVGELAIEACREEEPPTESA